MHKPAYILTFELLTPILHPLLIIKLIQNWLNACNNVDGPLQKGSRAQKIQNAIKLNKYQNW